MAAFNFHLDPRLTLNPQPPPTSNATAISELSGSVLRPPPPPPPTTSQHAGHLLTIHHPLMSSGRPILINPQGFPLAANHQFFGDGLYTPASLANSILSANLKESALDFNVLRSKSVSVVLNESSAIKEKLQVQNFKQISENQEKLVECYNRIDRPSDNNCNAPHDNKDGISDENRQIVSEINPNVSQPSVSNISAQSLPILSSNGANWNNPLPNVNFPLLGVNQMLPAGLVNQKVLVGRSFNLLGNVAPQLSTSSVPTMDQNSNALIKTIIHCKSCTLFPPSPNAPTPTTRERPQGCKTVFVGGLPENIKEEIVREVFDFCGEITNIRLSNKKFCHIRFSEESAVDEALTLSGYRIRLGSSSDTPNTGRLHVDFANARDDQYEFECKQRQAQREQRHRERILRENCREVSPSNPNHYTESEANSVLEKLKGNESFLKAISTTICWLDRGECNKRNVNTFYNMIQSVNSHVRRLLHDKSQCEADFQKAKELMRSRAQIILTQFVQIEKLFASSSHKKVWDHFTKAQRKNIELWKKSAMEIKNLPADSEESINDEMEVSDCDSEEGGCRKKQKLDISETNSLKDENDSLRCQLEAYKNEICVIRTELQCEVTKKNEQISILQKTLNSVTQEMEKFKRIHPNEPTNDTFEKKTQEADTTVIPALAMCSSVNEREARIIGLVSIFLHIHPFGAGVDYICSFLRKLIPSLRVTEIESIMSRFPVVFQQEVTGIGASMERRWKYIGFVNVDSDVPVIQL